MKYTYFRWLALLPVVYFPLLVSCAGNRPAGIGVTDGRLSPCPGKPNCVSSSAKDEKHAIQPFTYDSAKDKALEALISVLSKHERATIVVQRDDYLHIEFKSKLFGFVDDVEFYFPVDEHLIQVRSASRIGYSDLGVNRKRIEQLRIEFSEAMKSVDPYR